GVRTSALPISDAAGVFSDCNVARSEYHSDRATLQSLKTPAASASAKPGTTPLPAQPEVPSSAALSASDRLLKEANVLRERGDTANALARLQDASQRDPKNPQVLAEMAA